MSGVVKNLNTERYFEAGQMINHDAVFNHTDVLHDYHCETDVSTVKYSKETFLNICKQFPLIQEDMLAIAEDMNGTLIN